MGKGNDNVREKYRKTVEETVNKLIPYELSSGPSTYWDLIISAEDKEVKKGDFVFIKVEDIKIQPDSVMIPVSVIKHSTGDVVDMLPSEKGVIDGVVYLPTKGGVVRSGDVLGVVKIRTTFPLDNSKMRELVKKWSNRVMNLEDEMVEAIENSKWPYW